MAKPAAPPTSGGTHVTITEPFAVQTVKPAVSFLSRAVQPPSQVYVTSQDQLNCVAASSVTGEAVTVTYRLLLPNGMLQVGQFVLTVLSGRALATRSEALAEGFLLSVSVKAAAATTRGQTFVRLFLGNENLGVGQPSYMLMADYVTTAMAPGYPNGRQLTPVEGPGWPHLFAGTQPAAGADWVVTVPTNSRWRILSIFAVLVTSAVAGNRNLAIAFTVGGFAAGLNPATVSIPPSQVAQITFDSTAPLTAIVPGFWHVSIPDGELQTGGSIIVSETFGLDVADQWHAPQLYVEEWLDNV